MDENFGLREAADVGMFAQNLLLAFTAHGIGSCPQTTLGMNPDIIRTELGIEASNKLLFGLSFGYEDKSHQANNCRTSRANIEVTTRFIT